MSTQRPSFPRFADYLWNAATLPLRERVLIRMFISRDLRARYKNSWMGLLWLILNPLFMLSIYTMVFQHILGVKWGPQPSSGVSFALNLYLGLVVFNLFAESLQAAPMVLRVHANLIKKVRFPILILPTIPVAVALCDAMLGLMIWLIIHLLVQGIPPLTIAYLPIVILPFLLFVMGLCWFISSVSVYVRDTTQLIRFAMTGLLFLSPIFFPLEAMPASLQTILSFNPLAIEINMLRGIMVEGIAPAWDIYAGFLTFGALTYLAGYHWFTLTRDGFTDVL